MQIQTQALASQFKTKLIQKIALMNLRLTFNVEPHAGHCSVLRVRFYVCCVRTCVCVCVRVCVCVSIGASRMNLWTCARVYPNVCTKDAELRVMMSEPSSQQDCSCRLMTVTCCQRWRGLNRSGVMMMTVIISLQCFHRGVWLQRGDCRSFSASASSCSSSSSFFFFFFFFLLLLLLASNV